MLYGFLDVWVVGRHARLAGVQEFAPGDPLCRHVEIGRFIHDTWAFPTELKRNGSDELRSGFHDQLADRYAARKENIIKLLLQKVLVRFAAAEHHVHIVRRKGCVHDIRDHLRGSTRVIRRLQYGGISRRNGSASGSMVSWKGSSTAT